MRARIALLAGALACGAPGPELSSSDSDALVLLRRNGETSQLVWVRIADGAERVLRTSTEAEMAWPDWSAGAGRIVFQERLRSGERLDRLWLLDPHTGDEAPVSSEPALQEHWATWSPDGAYLVYSATTRRGRALAEVELASGERRLRVSTGLADPFVRPEYAPDGRTLLAQRRLHDWNAIRLWVLEPGLEPRALTGDGTAIELKGRFTRDGHWIVFTRREDADARADLVRVRPDGSDASTLASTPGSDDHSARPSPQRDEIVFVSDRDGSSDLFLVALENGVARNLTRTPEREEGAPRWSPDGERIALSARPVGAERGSDALRVVVIDREGRVLLETPGLMPDWMPAWR